MDMFTLMNFGRKFQDKEDKEWLSLYHLPTKNLHLAVKSDDTMPCTVFLVQEKEKTNEQSE